MILAALALLAEIALPPHAPCLAVATAVSSSEISVTWTRGMSEVDGVGHLDRDTLSWSPQTQAISYDVAEGVIGSTDASACFVTSIGFTVIATPAPAPGTGKWYIVRARNGCGAGTWGTTSTAERTVPVACGTP